MAIPPEEGGRAVACRVDLTLTYADPRFETTRHRDTCLRFGRRDASGSGGDWVVLQIRGRACEMASALRGDPNRTPRRPELERALIGRFSCFDPDGMAHCAPDPDRAVVEAFRCRPIARGEEDRARVACRVTARVGFPLRSTRLRLENECVRLDRITPADQSPAHWVAIYVPDRVRCELR